MGMKSFRRPGAGRAVSLLLGFALSMTAASGARADDVTFDYTVYCAGMAIGHHQVVAHTVDARAGGSADRVVVDTRTRIDASVLAIPVYHLDHQRREIWVGGRAVSINGRTDDDGQVYDVALRADGDGYIRTINGRDERFGPSQQMLLLWDKRILSRSAFFSVMDDKVMDVRFVRAGHERVEIAGWEIDAERYDMTGDQQGSIWYDADGRVVRVGFKRRGVDIAFVLDNPESAPKPLLASAR